jgi:hypothetical protein
LGNPTLSFASGDTASGSTNGGHGAVGALLLDTSFPLSRIAFNAVFNRGGGSASGNNGQVYILEVY